MKKVMMIAAAAAMLVACGGGGGGRPNFGDNEYPVVSAGTSETELQTTYPASIKGVQDVEIRPKVQGFLVQINVKEGQSVSAGQTLFVIDNETYQAQAGLAHPVDENEIKEFLYETGPLIAALNAEPLKDYTGGIVDLSSRQCRPSGVNHGVNLVGYGHDPETGKDYWICKMAWGENWGENGYFRIKRGSGTCCINSYIGTATVSFD